MDKNEHPVIWRNIEDLNLWEDNPRKISKAELDRLKRSLERDPDFMQAMPIVLSDRTGKLVIISGNQRYKGCKELGWKEVPTVLFHCKTEEEEVRKAMIANHNNGDWDTKLLADKFANYPLEEWLGSDWDALSGDFAKLEQKEVEEDDVPEVTEEEASDIKQGDIFILGGHKLMCGDATKKEDVQKLTGGGRLMIDLWLTDPPYNVAYEGGTDEKMTIMNDNMDDASFAEFLNHAFDAAESIMKPGAAFYIFYAVKESYNFYGACRHAKLEATEQLIWVKSSLIFGRSDYQYRHEPCQIPGTMVRTPNGEVPIEKLKDGDRVVSYNPNVGAVKGLKNGFKIKTAHRHYDGQIYGVKADGHQTWTTNNHRFSVRFNPKTANRWCTYLMLNERGWWRVGCTRTYDARQFGLKGRIHTEKAVAAWIISTYETQADAQMAEQYLSTKYGIPYTYWEIREGIKPTPTARTPRHIKWLYAKFDLNEMKKRAITLLNDNGRSFDYPLITKETGAQKFSRRTTARINACNLIPELMMVPVPLPKYRGAKTFEWAEIEAVDRKDYSGEVYSLAVKPHQHYIADGIVTHNCIYGWKKGSAHYFVYDRSLTTVKEDPEIDPDKMDEEELRKEVKKMLALPSTVQRYDKPNRNELHPTEKPVKLISYLISNSTKPNDNVLDTFGGSGTTLIACEQLGRHCYMMELDPKYCARIIKRWEKLTGEKAEKVK